MNEKEKKFLEALIRVKKLLEQNDLSYFLDTGTLLGAVRDKRFIPWDGDIDIGIYEHQQPPVKRLKEIAECFYKNGFNVRVTPGVISVFPAKDYIPIDIKFYEVVDNTYQTHLEESDSENNRLFAYLYFRFINRFLLDKKHGIKGLCDPIISFVLGRLGKIMPERVLNYLKMRLHYECKTVAIPCDLINGLTEIPFYGIDFSIPAFPEKYLAFRYGENWKTPNKDYKFITDDRSLL